MKKLLFPICTLLLSFCWSCKKTDENNNSVAISQIEQLVAKYSNLKLSSMPSTSKKVLNASDLQILDDSLAKLSLLMKSINIMPVEKKSLAIINNETSKNSIDLSTVPNDIITGGGSYPWTGYQTIGSSELGYYRINYFATFSYSTHFIYNSYINYLNSASGVTSYSGNASFSFGGTGKYETYNWSYSANSSTYTLSGNAQIANLSFSGTATMQHTVTTITGTPITVPVNGTSEGVSYNASVYSSTFPVISPN